MAPYVLSGSLDRMPLTELNPGLVFVGGYVGSAATSSEFAPAAEPVTAQTPKDFSALRAGLAAVRAKIDYYYAQQIPYAPPLSGYPYVNA